MFDSVETEILLFIEKEKPNSIKEIVEHIRKRFPLSKDSITHKVEKLNERNFIEKVVNLMDTRKKKLRIT